MRYVYINEIYEMKWKSKNSQEHLGPANAVIKLSLEMA